PWPDQDFHLPGFTHRGVSHSLLAILVVGGVLGAVGWFFGGNLFDLLLTVLLAGSDLFGWILVLLPDASAEMITLFLPNISLEAVVDRTHRIVSESVNQWTFATYGLFVGAYGIFAHLLGDVITKRGIKPFLPLSRWRLSLSSLRAESAVANSGLFFLGVLALAVVLAATVPGMVLGASAPADISPIGVVSGQQAGSSANQTQAGNQTTNQTGNQTRNVSEAALVFEDQTTSGSTVTVQSVTLSQPGFVAVHTSAYTNGLVGAEEAVIAISEYLPAGSYQNLSIDISHSPPANPPGLNRTRLNESQNLTVALFRDTNGNHRYDTVRSFGENDTLVTQNGTVVRDSARVHMPEPEPKAASVVFRNQTLRDNTLVVEKAHLPRGGFIVALNASYQRTGDPLTSVAGSSRYLPPGNHTNITIRLRPGAVGRTQVVTVMPSLDTNGNQRYDYLRTSGFHDIAYETLNHSGVITETALVRVPGSEQLTRTPGRATTVTDSLGRPSRTTSTAPPKPPTAVSQNESGSSGLFDSLNIWLVAAVVVVVLVVLPTIIRKFS
ncbi:MAG TPA: metal-dependent hydrolase, partial [Halococcus sp.]|nr:metal-dependent hydrolase [Halococcus sp.]